MSSYQVLARKCRPQRFSEIVGQEHITRTLQNAIRQHRVGHAYLFVGSRGIGKTTSARIFAKALNCESGESVTEPCCACQSCLEIAAGTSLDVMEIDGASHNKVEHIRDLREGVQYTPARGRYKIYIIDEVHMLTPQAWNALLKTLEEPPPHVKFFFATTEPHKVLPTIVSRCQRFDLKRLSVKLIAGRLKEIAQAETIPIEEGALVAIARAADGGMRDAQSIFDQIISFCGGSDSGPITEADVTNVFGLASGRELASLAAALLGNRADQALELISQLAGRGRDLERFYSDFVVFFRNVMVAQVCAEASNILDVSHAEFEDISAIARQTPPAMIRRVLEAVVTEESRLRMALNKRVYLEVALINVMDHLHAVQIDQVLHRLNQIRGTETVSAPEAQGAEPPKIVLPEKKTQDDIVPRGKDKPRKEVVEEAAGNDEVRTAGEAPPQGECRQDDAEDAAGAGAGGKKVRGEEIECREKGDDDSPPWDTADEPDAKTEPDVSDESDPAEDEPDTEEQADAADEASAARPDALATGAEAAEDGGAAELLGKLTNHFRGDPVQAFRLTAMSALRPVSFRQGVLELAHPEDMPDEQLKELTSGEMTTFLNDSLRRITGDAGSRILLKKWKDGFSDMDSSKRLVSSPEVMDRVKKNPFVQDALGLFQGELIDVRGESGTS